MHPLHTTNKVSAEKKLGEPLLDSIAEEDQDQVMTANL